MQESHKQSEDSNINTSVLSVPTPVPASENAVSLSLIHISEPTRPY